ncbi:dihydrodipicolinate synthase family protein [Maribellus comscasis]|uniref:Dihydrodipicolinate synthase family protein n=1 Tax=Maribellus comscasis TaxID=2681766 RepID=A0A6I6KA33_9BACT|nr:dihydrodipicolinate synthase family protein [Maribellus comscasis]QGY47004.1 dihydrodipicolinate synthase family protein [Maribellus comscasis]
MNIDLHGIIPPIVTPLKNENEIDEQGLKQLIEHIVAGGVHGIFLLGTTGEATSLSYQVRKEFIEKACLIINNRVPVVVGITDTSVRGSLEMAAVAKKSGADALVISTPYYLPMSQQEFVNYLNYLTPKLPLPFLLYNMPGCTKMHMSVETVKAAYQLGAIGIKDSSGDMGYLYALQEAFKNNPDFSVICGTELFLPESVTFGGKGAVPGGANIFPKIFVNLYEAAVNNDLNKISKLREIVIQIEKKIYNIGKDNSKYIKSIKCALSVIGICDDFVAQPFERFEKKECDLLRTNLHELIETYPEIKAEFNTLKTT